MENAIENSKVKRRIILRGVTISNALESGLIDHSHGFAFNYHIETIRENITSGGDDAVRVVREVLGFALGLTGTEVQRTIQPDSHQRRGVRSSVWTHCR